MMTSASWPLVMYVFCPADRRRADALQVAARSRLGHGNRGDDLAARHAWEERALLLFACVVEDVRRHDIGMESEARTGIEALRHLLDKNCAHEKIGAGAAVFLRDARQQQACLAGLAPELARDDAVLLPSVVVRRDLALDEILDGRAEHLMLLAEYRAWNSHDGRLQPIVML